MACPSGCLNGGAQIRYDDRETNESILTRMTDDYNALENYQPLTCEKFSPLFAQLKRDIDKQSLYTSFRAIQKEETNALTIKW
ncbi:Oidioi.mRNA.OKI2018_I69.XSR.g14408.t1.cds [Oikopleura dioica]|uniref:Oidioi.mRNA.OKI2018_I69.XSR.g14408.t1.cds n=1 Tax=Oikopleura dioica TaxID=34765 RepID=A0ABN7SA74_OIKDI|nr:Oidioi.mRNA.OKI2018_I69.XSR.g14408.t1.cds [Oikopleura dioica]